MAEAEQQTENGSDGDGDDEKGRLQKVVEFVFDLVELIFDLA